jgi:hypothetical protein
MRLNAARAAIPFEKPRLTATELSGRNGGPIEIVGKKQRDAAVAAALQADN